LLYSSSDQSPRIPINGDVAVLKAIAQRGRDIAECENESAWRFDDSPSFKSQIKKFSKDFKLMKSKIECGELSLYGESSKTPIISINGFSSKIFNLKVAGYDVVSTWLKFKSHIYTRTSFSKDDYRILLSLLCAVERQILLIEELDGVLKTKFQDINNWF